MSRITPPAAADSRYPRSKWTACLLALALAAALPLPGCVQSGLGPSDIPDIPPLDQPATVVPAGSFTTAAPAAPASAATAAQTDVTAIPTHATAPGNQLVLSARNTPSPVLVVAPGVVPPPVETPAPTPVPTPAPGMPTASTPPPVPASKAQAAAPQAPQAPADQRIAALELSLLNLANELAWLKSQPSDATTPWGTPSPRVVPQPEAFQPAPVPEAAKPANKAERAQLERMAAIERNMQAIRDELTNLGRAPQGTTPWGTPAPSLHAVTAPGTHVPQTQPGQTPTGQTPAAQTAQAPTAPATPVPTQVTTVTPPVIPGQPAPVLTITGYSPAPQTGFAAAPSAQTSGGQAVPHAAVQTPQPAPARSTPVLSHAQIMAQTGGQSVPAPITPGPVASTPQQAPPSQYVPPQAVNTQQTRPNAFQQVPGQQAPQPAPTPQQPAVKGEQGMYQQALNDYEARRYDAAWRGFDAYLAAYPNGRFAPNAAYWKGEVRYSQGDYPGAILLFKDVLTRFPQHQKAPDALLKTVLSYKRLNDTDNAALHLRILQEDYPQSPATQRARSMNLS